MRVQGKKKTLKGHSLSFDANPKFPFVATPRRSAPESPKILNHYTQDEQEEGELPIIASSYADRFELIWNRPADNGEPIDFYTIRFCPVSFSGIFLFQLELIEMILSHLGRKNK